MERLSVLSMTLLLFACVQPSHGDCTCGQSCTMEGGGTGVCFEDGTCAVSIMAVQCPLNVGDVCHSGGVETGPGVDRRSDCPEGSSCRPRTGEMAIGGEVTSTCQLDPLEIGDVCHSGGVETGEGVDRRKDCPLGSSCQPKAGEMAIGGEVTSTCQLDPLEIGDVCHSGGVETGEGVDRRKDCPLGSSCQPKAGEMAIGGEVTSTCQLDPLEIGDVCHSGGVETGEAVDRRKDCPLGSSCQPKAGQMAIGGEVTSTCQLDDLQLGDVCKSGGVESGPGVEREHDCPIGSVCSPKDGEMAIGGEVTSICQAHDNPLPLGGICSTSGSLGFSATTCVGDIVCILIDAGRPEIDIPNRGMCLPAGAALPVGATCYKASDSTEAIGAIPCAPSLHCVLSQSSEDPLAMTCQPVNGSPVEPVVQEDVPSTASTLMRHSCLATVGALLWLVRA